MSLSMNCYENIFRINGNPFCCFICWLMICLGEHPSMVAQTTHWNPWWRHQMGTFSAKLTFFEGNLLVTSGFPSKRPAIRSFNIFFDLRLNKRLNKQSRRRRFETPSPLSWLHCNEVMIRAMEYILWILGPHSRVEKSHIYIDEYNFTHESIINNWRMYVMSFDSLQWRHNERDGVSNHQPHDYSLNCLFMYTSRKKSKLRVTSLCEGNSPVTGESPHKRPVTRKKFPFGDVIMHQAWSIRARINNCLSI